MISRAVPVFLVAAALSLGGCRQLLDIPSDPEAIDGSVGEDDGSSDGDGADADDGGDRDASPGRDSGPGGDGAAGCGNHDLSIGFDDPNELDGWQVDIRRGCDIAVEGGRLVLRQLEGTGFCRIFRELSMDLIDYGLEIQVAVSGNEQMSMVYSVVLQDGTNDIEQRRRLRIERLAGEIRFGECTGDGCGSQTHGSFPYDPDRHRWWRFDHDRAAEHVYVEFADDSKAFFRPEGITPAVGITDELVACVGVELGTYPVDLAATGTAAFDSLVGASGSL